MGKKLYISDLDGTLLRNDASLSKYTISILNSLIDKGVLFSVASARSVVSIRKVLNGLNLKLPIIEFNGAFTSSFETMEHYDINGIEENLKNKIYNEIKQRGFDFFLSTYHRCKDKLYFTDISNEGLKWYYNNRKKNNDIRLQENVDIEEKLNEEVICFNIINTKDNLIDFYKLLKSKYSKNITIKLIENKQGWYWLTIHSNKAKKSIAIEKLANKFKIRKEDIIVFGDNFNDIDMIKNAGTGVAVDNSIDELKKIADCIIGSNEQDSVAKFINNHYKINLY